MRRCHHITDGLEKVFIPGCEGGAAHGPHACTCKRTTSAPDITKVEATKKTAFVILKIGQGSPDERGRLHIMSERHLTDGTRKGQAFFTTIGNRVRYWNSRLVPVRIEKS